MSDTAITLTVDGRPVTVPKGTTILKAAEAAGIAIPTLCHRDGLEPFTSCFICVVEVEGKPNPVPSCGTEALAGMVVRTNTDRIRQTRRVCLELLLSDHSGDCVAPCTLTCPAGLTIQQMMGAIGQGRLEDAIRIVKDALPIPGCLGRVCPHPCEAQCRRVTLEEPLAICWLHRHAADTDARGGRTYTPPVGAPTGKRVAVIGAGPAGMSAAYFLRRLGHAVTVFESRGEPGGMLRWGIPAYRLPRAEIAREFNAIADMGVEMRYGRALGRDFHLADLRTEGFHAIFLATGAPFSSPMRVQGEDLPGVFGGVDFLERAARGEPVPIGKRVVVIGGGNTAIDAVRTARRLGAESVTLLYRRTRAEMPALPVEIHEAEREGAQFRFLAAPLSVRAADGRLVLACQPMELGEPGPDGRRKPVPIQGQSFELEADSVIAAIGQRVDAELLKREGLELDKWGSAVVVNPATMQTSAPDVFAGGDVAAREDQKIAVWAVGSGHLAALAMDQFLNGRAVVGKPRSFQIAMGKTPQDVTPSRFAAYEKIERARMPEVPPEERLADFREVELGLNPENARSEATRCLACGCGAAGDCRVREYALEYGADPERLAGATRDYSLETNHPDILIEPGKCISCGICVRMGRYAPGKELFGFVNRGFDTRVTAYFTAPLDPADAEAFLRCADACPTGALMSRQELGANLCACLAPCARGA
jgi:formate dehydrogenase major subunit